MKFSTIAILVFGCSLACGALGEILIAIRPSLIPSEATQIPIMAQHVTATGLRAWVLASNVVNLYCALTLVRAAWQPATPGAWRSIRRAATTLMATILMSQAVTAWYFFPMPTDPALAQASEAFGATMLLSSAAMLGVLAAFRTIASRHELSA